MRDDHATHLALRGQLLTAAALPEACAWENVDFTPPTAAEYIEEEFVPATPTLLTTVSHGVLESPGLYVAKVYGFANTGAAAIRTITTSILGVFLPGSALTLGNGDVVRIRGDVAPWAGQILPQGNGRAVSTVTVPFRVYSTNQ